MIHHDPCTRDWEHILYKVRYPQRLANSHGLKAHLFAPASPLIVFDLTFARKSLGTLCCHHLNHERTHLSCEKSIEFHRAGLRGCLNGARGQPGRDLQDFRC